MYSGQTAVTNLVAGIPGVIEIESLQADEKYYYRVGYREPGVTSYIMGSEYSFHTQRGATQSFTFVIEADPHWQDPNASISPLVWQVALSNMLADRPDFLVDLGDTFMTEKLGVTNAAGAAQLCKDVRNNLFSITGHSVPLFLVNGNHESELGWLLSQSMPQSNIAVWATEARQRYYPCPVPGSFYSGTTNIDPYIQGPRDDHYAFTWGNTMFVVLDPFWNTAPKPGPATGWNWTLGTNQYYWLQQTLSQSTATFKFVFIHHLVGGSFDGAARGGLELAPYFEWGGYNTNGTWGFTANRPGWALPVQSLLLSNGVSAVFHGHDHLYVKQDLDSNGDGIPELIYQECPQPSATNYNSTASAIGYGYTNGILQGSSGHLRVSVTPSRVTVEYVRAYLPEDLAAGKTNGMVTSSYTIPERPNYPPVISSLGITAAPPSTNGTAWVTATVTDDFGLASVVLNYTKKAGGIGWKNTIMYDDGLHGDGLADDGTYGVLMPPQNAGTPISYYLTATDSEGLVTTNPAGASDAPLIFTSVNEPNLVLGRPTSGSITLNALADTNLMIYIDCGTNAGLFFGQSVLTNLVALEPLELTLGGLQADARYLYRVGYKQAGESLYHMGPLHDFHTQRAPGSTFTFSIQGDSHPERVNTMFDSALYMKTLLTAASDHPDFYMTIGDDFSVDQIPTNSISAALVAGRYTLQRPYLGLTGCSAPLFLVNGNHEQAAAYLLDGTSNNIAVWAQTARNRYYPEPAPDRFYSGNTNVVPFIGLLRNYYAWTWGDALFVTIDPYWGSTNCVDNNYWTGVKRTNMWDVTHGDAQYQWLKATLEQSTARFKFVFAHHVLGTGRGGIEEAGLCEWGGRNQNNTWGFSFNRPTWSLPLHQLMATNHVTIFFQGHDHLFVRQQLDGVTYLTLPCPADPTYTFWNADAYTNSIYKTNDTGYVRITVSPENVKVDYVRTFLPVDEGSGKTNGMVDYSFTLPSWAVDTVGDGVPDWWRALYFGGNGTTTNAASCATGDPDGDGFINISEYLADTDPGKSGSCFAIQSFTITPEGQALTWIGGSNTWQYLEYSPDLRSNQWIALYTIAPSSGITNIVIQPGVSNSLFYRINARR